jgi:putative transposase
MRQPQYTLTRQDVHRHAAHRLQAHLKFPDYGRRCTAGMLWAALLAAAARLTSLFAAARRLLGLPSEETLRKALLAALPGRADLERRLNRALAADLPKCLARSARPLACDLTLLPYHGRPLHDPAEVYRGQAKSGTSHFHAYATAYVVCHGRRYTLALTAVSRGEPLEEVLRRLLRRVGRLGLRARYLLLDRGFCTVGVIRYLQAARRPFLMPLPLRGRAADHPGGPSGSRAFQYARRSGWGTYTLASRTRTATVRVCVKCRNYAGQWGRRGRQRLVYAFWGLEPKSFDWVREAYRRRFAIEASYRQMNQARTRTSTRNPDARLLFVGIALVLRNVWVWLHWQVLSQPRRGGRRLRLERLRFRAMLLWVLHAVEDLYATWDEAATERPIPQPRAA